MNTSPAVAAFRALHEKGCFFLPNPADVGQAVLLHALGFQALASTSSGFAFTMGLPDDSRAVTLESALDHLRALAAATPLPVNADFMNGFADEPDAVAMNVDRCIATGVAGLSIEDSTGLATSPLYERALAIERVKAARAAVDRSGVPVVLTARCEAFLVGVADPVRISLDRLVAFADAGADCLFAPGARDPDTIAALVKAVAPKPINVLVGAPIPGLGYQRLADLGVRRISVGAALARVGWGAFRRAALLLKDGSFDGLADSMPYAELNTLFAKRG